MLINYSLAKGSYSLSAKHSYLMIEYIFCKKKCIVYNGDVNDMMILNAEISLKCLFLFSCNILLISLALNFDEIFCPCTSLRFSSVLKIEEITKSFIRRVNTKIRMNPLSSKK